MSPEPPSFDTGRLPSRSSRRRFLIGASTLVVAACSSSDESDPDAAGSTSPADQDSTGVDESTTSTPPTTSSESGGGESDPTTTVEPDVDDAVNDGPTVPVLTPAMFDDLAICTATAAAGEGPFPSPELLDRRDIAEGYPGHPLRLGIRVVDATCAPVPGATVDIWHTDAGGDYSAYADNGDGKDEGEGSTFCRGVQTADEDGILEFQTIFPGWYPGRTVHIHATARAPDGRTLTTQLYFDEAATAEIFTTGEYAQFGQPDTTWANDRLVGDPANDGTGVSLAPAETWNGPGTLGLINIGLS